jgi:hypothetical protein
VFGTDLFQSPEGYGQSAKSSRASRSALANMLKNRGLAFHASFPWLSRHGLRAQRCEFNMKFRMDTTLRFWVDVAYEDIKSDHEQLATKKQPSPQP